MPAHWLKTLVLAAALAVMPLQGIAATLSFLLCHGEAQAHETHGGQSHDHGTAAGGHHDHKAGGDEGSSSVAVPYHLCCHFAVTAPLDVTLALPQQDFPLLALAPERLHNLFIPDRPQRPPLA